MGYYYKTSTKKNLNVNDRLYILYGLKKKYVKTDIDTAIIENEISKLEPKRIKKSVPSSSADPIQKDLDYYYRISSSVKLDVNDMLYILYKIRNKYVGKGVSLATIDTEITKLNPQWTGESKPVEHETVYTIESMGEDQHGIKPGDVLGISIYPLERFSGELVVNENGTIDLPLIGSIHAKGMSLEKLSETIQEKLVRYVTNPLATVIRHAFTKNQIVITGEVSSPGAYQYSGDLTIAELISLAGGFTENADDVTVKLHRCLQTPGVVSITGRCMAFAEQFPESGPGSSLPVLGLCSALCGECQTGLRAFRYLLQIFQGRIP